jgi:hypothetical protein
MDRFLISMKERVSVWRRIIVFSWNRYVLLAFAVLSAIDLIARNVFDRFIPRLALPWWGWALIVSIVTIFLILEGAFHLIPKSRANWIDDYYREYGKNPPIPPYLVKLVYNYTVGEPVSKKIQTHDPSGQSWYRLPPSQKDEFIQLYEWLGKDPRDFLARMEMSKSKNPPNAVNHKPFQQH